MQSSPRLHKQYSLSPRPTFWVSTLSIHSHSAPTLLELSPQHPTPVAPLVPLIESRAVPKLFPGLLPMRVVTRQREGLYEGSTMFQEGCS